jgi:PAS domain S-box-containing protein
MLFSVFIFPGNLPGEYSDIKFEHISSEQGLSQNTVFCFLQDSIGFLWTGTQNGLNRYDGHTFKVYYNDPGDPNSLSHGFVISIYEDQSGILWIGTWGGGLNKFDRETETFTTYKHIPGNAKSLSNNNVRAICEDNSGTLWIGTDNGLNRFDREKQEFIHYPVGKSIDSSKPNGQRINSMLKDKTGKILVGTDKGLYYCKQEEDGFSITKCQKKSTERDFIPQKISALHETNEGILWVGTGKGLYNLIQENDEIIHDTREINRKFDRLKDERISSIYRDSAGKLWIGTQNNGFFLFNPQEEHLAHHKCDRQDPDSLNHMEVLSIYEDKSGVIWIGTDGGGINKFDPKRKKFNLYRNVPGDPNSLSYDDVMAICRGKNDIIWIGTRGKGINKFDPKEKRFYHYEIPHTVSKNPNRNKISAVREDNDGVVWVGADEAGLYKFIPEKEIFVHEKELVKENEDVVCLYVDKQNVLWVGTMDGGLIQIDKNREKSRRYKNNANDPNSLSDDKVFSICEDSYGALWVGTASGGLNKFDKKEQFIRYRHKQGDPTSLSHNFIITIYRDRSGTMWTGTNGGGINKINSQPDQKETFSAYYNHDGFASNVIYAILEDNDNNLWLSTNKGLSRFNPRANTFRNYTIRDDLQGYEFNGRVACKDKKGEMYFGGINGLNSFDPGKIGEKENKSPPPVIITSFKRQGQEVKLDPSITNRECLELSYRDDFISLEFAALDFSEPDKNQYKYKLEPIHKDWIYSGYKNNVDLINLEPGKYQFRVMGSNNDGAWSEPGKSIKIIVTPPFTQTLWFYICLVGFIGGSILGFVGWRINNIKNTNRRLQKEIDERLRTEEKLLEKEELYRNLVDTSPDAITLCDIKGNIIMSNLQACSLLGYSVDEMYKDVKSIFRLLSGEDRKKARLYGKRTLRKGITRNAEFNLIAKNGTRIPVEISSSAIEDTEGRPKYLLEVARDIRERKEAEKKEKLHRERITRVEKMAALGRLVSGVAHELNNPAASIKINADIFDRLWKDIVPVLDKYHKEKKEFSMADLPYLEAKTRVDELIIGLMENSLRIEKIINELGYFSKPVDLITWELININKVIQSSVNLTNNMIQEATRRFYIKLAKNLPLIKGDFQKLEQVFINLIRNACQALPDNNKGIFIKSYYNKESKHIEIKVKDWGGGVEEKDLRCVTDPFFTTKRSKGGIGLGLSTSMQIIQEHKGTIMFKSQVGKGTTVIVQLPVKN